MSKKPKATAPDEVPDDVQDSAEDDVQDAAMDAEQDDVPVPVEAPPRPASLHWLARIVEAVMADPPWRTEPGGLAVYRRNPAHGPFVHVDTRGRRARW